MTPWFRRLFGGGTGRDGGESGPGRAVTPPDPGAVGEGAGAPAGVTAGGSPAQAELRHADRWVVVVPVKPSARAKSRLAVDGVDRSGLARAIALDTLAAVSACELVVQVVVVTDDAALAREAAVIPALRFVPEGESRGLDAAVATGMAAVDPNGRLPRAALLGDLPALRPADLAEALRAAGSVDRVVVADAEGTGSTLVTARAGAAWSSSFGDDSLARHVAAGCEPLGIRDASTLRRDVDTADQLAAAVRLGVGPRTAALLASVPGR
ncbi:2-phospho-L-lactate guanylyltransferase [Microbacterium gallinarum]|uniref:2-phospho-L-lactate guanylyltransferase n=1 Tax=Microbacterium gallinarum TaxID=2762209 RepID=UPI0029700738|nr:2-phospho-L-lactate guanylyltransferase [Microbacterium gallinarum]